jgi:type IV pilus assembly protein PilA
MLSSLKFEDAKREEGFTLIELLVVVIIIGILAAIAIPVFLNQRTSARESAVESTLRSAATYMEIVYTGANDYPSTEGALAGEGFRSGDRVDILTIVPDNTAGTYIITAEHADDETVVGCFNSEIGTPLLAATCPTP